MMKGLPLKLETIFDRLETLITDTSDYVKRKSVMIGDKNYTISFYRWINTKNDVNKYIQLVSILIEKIIVKNFKAYSRLVEISDTVGVNLDRLMVVIIDEAFGLIEDRRDDDFYCLNIYLSGVLREILSNLEVYVYSGKEYFVIVENNFKKEWDLN